MFATARHLSGLTAVAENDILLTSIAQLAPTIIAGSALSGFGLSFGRDVYRKTKENWPLLVLLVTFVGVFFSGLWLFRNYRTVTGTIFKKFSALILFVVSVVGLYLLMMAAAPFFILVFGPVVAALVNIVGAKFAGGTILASFILLVSIQVIMFLTGAFVGIRHRKKRRWAWEAEMHNKRFLVENGLQVISSDEHFRLKDIQENLNYRFIEDLDITGSFEFILIGHRNKRAYIEYDETGKFTSWSGLTKL